jgi:glutamate formiminotransferase/formiminotetrahydrofolate cyclodeaminase
MYGEAAALQERILLSRLRRGEYEGLRERFSGRDCADHTEETRWPDHGPRQWSDEISRSGATVIGARQILVAYNVNLDEKEACVAKIVGALVRTSGRLVKRNQGSKIRIPGILPQVQAMGVPLDSHGISQVSMNLQDIAITPMHIVFEAVRLLAADHSVSTAGSELVGLAPLQCFTVAGKWFLGEDEQDEETLVKAAIEGLGLDALGPFDPQQRIIEWAVDSE